MAEIRLKILPAASAFRVSRETLRRGLEALQAKPDASGAYLLYDIHRAIAGDKQLEMIRSYRLENELKEVELAERRNQMMDTAAAMALWNSWALPIRQKLTSLPAEMKHRCNPTDPELAGKALSEWTVAVMRLIQAEIKRVAEETNREPKTNEEIDRQDIP